MKEATYQHKLVQRLKQVFPGCQIIKLDPSKNQGIPDILILYMDQWALLEVKASNVAPEQPNQAYYIELFDNMSFAAFINPENEEQVLSDLQQSFRAGREARLS